MIHIKIPFGIKKNINNKNPATAGFFIGGNMSTFKLSKKQVAAIKSYLRAVLASAIVLGIALLTDMAPQYAVLIGAVAGPALKWADANEGDFGRGSKG